MQKPWLAALAALKPAKHLTGGFWTVNACINGLADLKTIRSRLTSNRPGSNSSGGPSHGSQRPHADDLASAASAGCRSTPRNVSRQVGDEELGLHIMFYTGLVAEGLLGALVNNSGTGAGGRMHLDLPPHRASAAPGLKGTDQPAGIRCAGGHGGEDRLSRRPPHSQTTPVTRFLDSQHSISQLARPRRDTHNMGFHWIASRAHQADCAHLRAGCRFRVLCRTPAPGGSCTNRPNTPEQLGVPCYKQYRPSGGADRWLSALPELHHAR